MPKSKEMAPVIPIRSVSFDVDFDTFVPLAFNDSELAILCEIVDIIGEKYADVGAFLLQRAENLAQDGQPFAAIVDDMRHCVAEMSKHMPAA